MNTLQRLTAWLTQVVVWPPRRTLRQPPALKVSAEAKYLGGLRTVVVVATLVNPAQRRVAVSVCLRLRGEELQPVAVNPMGLGKWAQARVDVFHLQTDSAGSLEAMVLVHPVLGIQCGYPWAGIDAVRLEEVDVVTRAWAFGGPATGYVVAIDAPLTAEFLCSAESVQGVETITCPVHLSPPPPTPPPPEDVR